MPLGVLPEHASVLALVRWFCHRRLGDRLASGPTSCVASSMMVFHWDQSCFRLQAVQKQRRFTQMRLSIVRALASAHGPLRMVSCSFAKADGLSKRVSLCLYVIWSLQPRHWG